MLFHEFGPIHAPTVLLMHGMLQDWHSEYEMLRPLENHFRLILPAMDGMYPGSPDFTSFADQSRQIEEYISLHHNSRICGAYGASQGGLMLVELLTRNQIGIDTAVMDGVYVAHQGKAAAWGTFQMMNHRRKTGRFPGVIAVMMKLMGLGQEDMKMFDAMYWDVSEESMRRNLYENYTYHTDPAIRNTKTKIHLWCGSREPYALKSHKILKKYITPCEEIIFPDMGHGQMLLYHRREICDRLCSVFSGEKT
ncbi:MAG: alpha/beta hydrolase [Clostridia bacterium]|nr:alpha/beta hydrolase [Clostridia bacterium]